MESRFDLVLGRNIMKKFNVYIIPIMSLLLSFASLSVGIGGLILVKSFSNALVMSGFVSSIGSIGLIIATLFVGSAMDHVKKKRIVVVSNFILGALLLIPFAFTNRKFLYAFIVVDLFMGLISLVSGLAFNGSIKRYVPDKLVDTVISRTTAFSSVGYVLSLISVFVFVTTPNGYKTLLIIGSACYFLCGIASIFINEKHEKGNLRPDEEFAQNTNLQQIKKIYELIKHHVGLRSSIILNISIMLLQVVFNGLIVYFWNRLDPNYANAQWLLISYGVGIGLALICLKLRLNLTMRFGLLVLLCLSMITFSVTQSMWSLMVAIAMVMLTTVPIENWVKRTRIRQTSLTIQSGQESFVEFGISVFEIVFNTGIAGIFDYFKKPSWTLVVLSLVTLISFIIYGKGMQEYEQALLKKKGRN